MGTLALRKYGIDLNDLFGLHFFKASTFEYGSLVTYMFLHERIPTYILQYVCSLDVRPYHG